MAYVTCVYKLIKIVVLRSCAFLNVVFSFKIQYIGNLLDPSKDDYLQEFISFKSWILG